MKKKIQPKSKSLSDKALLVSVNISQWAARKIDKKATLTANVAHKADDSAGNYHKKLLPHAAELEAIGTLVSQARKYFYEQTLPWMSDGSRIISSKNYFDFTAQMKKIKSDFDHAVGEFTVAYPKLQKAAESKLGELYDAGEYPHPDEIAEKFKIEVTYLPLPDVKDFRTEISAAEKKEFEKKIKEVETAAMKDCWERLYKVVKTAADRLSQPDAMFRESMISNIAEMVEILPKLNVTDDEDLEKARIEVEKTISGLSADDLRLNRTERERASKALADIEKSMGAFMGANK
jgi:hypothetical protein